MAIVNDIEIILTKYLYFPDRAGMLLEDRGVRHLEVHQEVTARTVDVSTAALTILTIRSLYEYNKSNHLRFGKEKLSILSKRF